MTNENNLLKKAKRMIYVNLAMSEGLYGNTKNSENHKRLDNPEFADFLAGNRREIYVVHNKKPKESKCKFGEIERCLINNLDSVYEIDNLPKINMSKADEVKE